MAAPARPPRSEPPKRRPRVIRRFVDDFSHHRRAPRATGTSSRSPDMPTLCRDMARSPAGKPGTRLRSAADDAERGRRRRRNASARTPFARPAGGCSRTGIIRGRSPGGPKPGTAYRAPPAKQAHGSPVRAEKRKNPSREKTVPSAAPRPKRDCLFLRRRFGASKGRAPALRAQKGSRAPIRRLPARGRPIGSNVTPARRRL